MTTTMCQHNNTGPELTQRRRTSLYMSLLQVKSQESEFATKKKSSTSVFTKDYGPTTFITGMRAYAAVAVMLTHAGGAGLRTLGPLGQHLMELGAQGVTVFFVISGFSVASSWEHSGSFTAYLCKRLARIVPLYYAWLFAATLTSTDAIEWQRRYGTSIDAYNMIMHLTFMSWCDYRIACTILGVEWSIPVEVIWYLAIPFLLQLMSTAPRVACAVAGSLAWLVIVIGIKQILPLTAEDSAYAIHWSPLPYATSFVTGIAAYRIRQWRSTSSFSAAVVVLAAPLAIVAWASLATPLSHTATYLFFTALSFCLIVFGEQSSSVFRGIFCNRATLLIGTISYGIYLSHMPLLRLLPYRRLSEEFHPAVAFALFAICTFGVSALTYIAIERPFGRLATKLVAR